MKPLLACGIAAALACAVYLNAVRNPFVYDDYRTIVENPSIHERASLLPIVLYDRTRPLTNLSFALDHALWGGGTPTPLRFHVTNIAFHTLNVVLLFQLAAALARQRYGPSATFAAFAAASLLAVHPMTTEAVGYISGRFEVLCTTFFLAALLSGRRWLAGSGARWSVVTVTFWLAALASKETAAVFPLVLFALDLLAPVAGGAADFRRRLRRVHLPLIAAAAMLGTMRLGFLAAVEADPPLAFRWDFLLVALDVLRRYLALLANPSGQTIFHQVSAIDSPLNPRAVLSVALLALLGALAWRMRRAEPRVTLGIVWFLLAMAPSTVLLLLNRGEPMAEHRVYLASAGVFLAVGAAVATVASMARTHRWLAHAGMATLGIVLTVFSALTITRNRIWSDPVTLWRESAELAPTHYRPRLLLGEALHDQGHVDQAVVQFREATRLRPAEPAAWVKLGQALAENRRLDEARQAFEQALIIDPDNEAVRHSVAVLAAMAEAEGRTDGR